MSAPLASEHNEQDATPDDREASFEQFNPATNRPRRRRTEVDEYDSILWRMESLLEGSDAVANLYGVVGASKGVGTTTVAMNLANRLIDHVDGNVLLVDANFYRPRAERLLNLKKNPGLSEVLTDGMPLAEAVQRSRVPGLELLASGRGGRLEQIGLDPDSVVALISEMRESYSGVVFDFSEATCMGPSFLLARECDGVLIVARSEKTSRTEAETAIEQLRQDGVHVLGAVLNRYQNRVPGWLRRWS